MAAFKKMIDGFRNGSKLLRDSVLVFRRHPSLLLPIFLVWCVYAPILLYFQYFFDWEPYSLKQSMGIVFTIILFFASLLSVSCSVLLELLQQLESGQRASFFTAAYHTFRHNFLRMLPLIVLWAIVWFVLSVIQTIFSKSRSRGDGNLSAESAARTLAGENAFSLSAAFFESLKKGVRMIMFLIFPAIAWDNLRTIAATRKGLRVFRTHLSAFVGGFILTEGAALIIFLPAAIVLMVGDNNDLPGFVWYATIVYIGFSWSFVIYLEQMFSAELYLWNMKWERAVERARREGSTLPTLGDVPRPSLLDEVPDLLDDSIPVRATAIALESPEAR